MKGQCAKNYFYGEDLGLERALQTFEGEYARVLRNLQDGAEDPTSQDLSLLRDFAYLQSARTDMAAKRSRMAQEGMHNEIYEGRPVTAPDLDVSDRAMMLHSMRMYAGVREYIEDLKVCVVRNETDFDFVTSDDPSIFTNRFYLQRLGQRTFGVASSGALLFMPLTPRLLLICYDGGVYTIPSKGRCYLSINKVLDALGLNELQYLKAAENIYFARWRDCESIEREFGKVSAERPSSWWNFTTLVPDGFTEEGQRYRRATDEERTTARETLVAGSTVHPAPSRWLSKLRFRQPVRTFFEGTAVGHVRKREWLRSERRSLVGP